MRKLHIQIEKFDEHYMGECIEYPCFADGSTIQIVTDKIKKMIPGHIEVLKKYNPELIKHNIIIAEIEV